MTQQTEKIRVLAIDDHALFRSCMVGFLDSDTDIEVVGEASSSQQGRIMACELQPDIALVDLDLGGHDGMEVAKEIVSCCPDCAVIILTAYQDQEQMLRALRIGARGYLLKDIAPDDLLKELHRVVRGEMLFPKDFAITQLRNNLQANGSADSRPDKLLTPRELEVLQLVADGLTDKEVAKKLSISEHTIKNHMKAVRRKLGTSNRVQAILSGIKMGIVKEKGITKSTHAHKLR